MITANFWLSKSVFNLSQASDEIYAFFVSSLKFTSDIIYLTRRDILFAKLDIIDKAQPSIYYVKVWVRLHTVFDTYYILILVINTTLNKITSNK